MHPETTIRPHSHFSFGWKELWHYRELLYFFTWKEIKVRYKQAFLGVTWTLLQPVSMMLVFVLVLSKGLNIPTGTIPAPLYYLAGLLVWNLFNHAVTNASQSMVANASIIKKIYFPRLVIPISSVLTATFDYLISCAAFLVILVYYKVSGAYSAPFWKVILALGWAWLITVLIAFSIGTLLSAINVKYRDVRYVLPFLIQSIFFITPIMYDSSMFRHSWASGLLQLNPLSHAISGLRVALGQEVTFADPVHSFYLLGNLIVLYLIAIFVFRRTESYFADIV